MKNFVLIFPTKYERNQWFSFVKKFLLDRKGKQKTKLIEIQLDCLKNRENLKTNCVQMRTRVIKDLIMGTDFSGISRLNLAIINTKLVDQRKKLYANSTRKTINLNDLRNMTDFDNSRTNLDLRFTENGEDEKILCFLDDSEAEETPVVALKK